MGRIVLLRGLFRRIKAVTDVNKGVTRGSLALILEDVIVVRLRDRNDLEWLRIGEGLEIVRRILKDVTSDTIGADIVINFPVEAGIRSTGFECHVNAPMKKITTATMSNARPASTHPPNL